MKLLEEYLGFDYYRLTGTHPSYCFPVERFVINIVPGFSSSHLVFLTYVSF